MGSLTQLSKDLLIVIVNKLSTEDLQCARLVCASWERAFSLAVLSLRPNALCFRRGLSRTFPELQQVSLSRCNQKEVNDEHITDVAKLKCLQDLSLRNCKKLTSTSANAFQGIRGLRRLDIANCDLFGEEAFGQLCKCPSLESLNCSNISAIADGCIKALQLLTSLRYLELTCTPNLTELGFRYLGQLTSLTHLRLDNISRRQAPHLGLRAFPAQLKRLDLVSCHIRGVELCSLTCLTHLYICDCPALTAEGLATISATKSLTHLFLEFCDGLTDSMLAQLQSDPLPKLCVLSLRHCKLVSSAGLESIKKHTNLAELYLDGCIYLDGSAAEHVAAVAGLRVLSMQGCERVDDSCLHSIASLPRLSTLSLKACPYVTDQGLVHLANACTALTSLDLAGCNSIRDAGVLRAGSMPALKFLNVSTCKSITAEGVQKLQALTNLQQLINLPASNPILRRISRGSAQHALPQEPDTFRFA